MGNMKGSVHAKGNGEHRNSARWWTTTNMDSLYLIPQTQEGRVADFHANLIESLTVLSCACQDLVILTRLLACFSDSRHHMLRCAVRHPRFAFPA